MNQVMTASERRRQGLGVAQTIIATSGAPQPPRISTLDQKFWLIDDKGVKFQVPTHHLDVVVVAVNPAKINQFYKEKYVPGADDGSFKPPTCFSWDGLVPDDASAEKQHATCAGCPMAVWGSRLNEQTGEKRRACDQAYALALLPLVDGVEIHTAFRFLLKGGSFKNFVEYAKKVSQYDHQSFGRKADLSDLVTRLTLNQNVFSFQEIAWNNAAVEAKIEKILDSGLADQLTGVEPYGGAAMALPAPKPQAQLAAPVAFAAPAQTANEQSAAEFEEKQKRHRRTKAEMEAARAAEEAKRMGQMPLPLDVPPPAVAPVADDEIPAFLRRAPANLEASPELKTSFGVAQAQAPDAALQANIAKAFGVVK